MSVMTPEELRRGSGVDMRGRPIQPLQPVAPQGPTTSAVLAGLGVPGAQAPLPSSAPVATNPGTFARGGQVKQVPTAGVGGIVGNLGASVGSQFAGKEAAKQGLKGATSLGTGAAGAATSAGVGLATGLIADKLATHGDMPTFGGENGEYLDDYGRRFQGTGGGAASNAVRYAGYGAAAGPIGMGVGALAGLVKNQITKHAKSANTDFRVEDAAQAIKDAYKGELGREASDDEVQAALVGQGWDPTGGDRWVGEKGINSVLDQIRSSPEAQAFRTNGAQSATGAEPVATMHDVAAAMTGEGAGGGQGQLEGFDAEKLASGHTSPKYVFARAAQGVSNTDPDRSAKILAALKADPSGYFANATLTGDKLQVNNADPVFDGINEFDIQRDEENGGGFHWEPTGQGGGGGGDADAQLMGLLAGGQGGAPATPTGDGSSLPGVMAAIQKLLASQGQTNSAGYTDALLRELNATA